MSGASPDWSLDPEVRAAILWDPNALRRGSAAARNFLAAFGPPPRDLDEDATGILQIAAAGLRLSAEGNSDGAVELWNGLLESSQPEPRLLGCLLRAWLVTDGVQHRQDLETALELGRLVEQSEDRSRICRKIAIAALDKGSIKLAKDAASIALEASPEGSDLQRNIRVLLWDVGDRSFEYLGAGSLTDELLTQPWLTERAFGAAVDADLRDFRTHLSSVWSNSVHFGQTPIDVLNALQRQAEWAGRPALRDSIIHLMCTHILRDPHAPEASVQWAASAWVLSGGRDAGAVLNRVEPRLDASFARYLISAVRDTPQAADRLPAVALSTWRLMADEDVDLILSSLDPGTLNPPTAPEGRQTWGNLIWRNSGLWMTRWGELDGERQISAVSELLPHVVDEIDRTDIERLLAACAEAPTEALHAVARFALAASHVVEAANDRWLEVVTPGDLVSVTRWCRSAVADETLTTMIARQQALIREQREAAHEGTLGIGGSQITYAGQLVAELGRPDPETEGLLLEVFEDPLVASDDQIQAADALAAIHRAGFLSTDALVRLHERPVQVGRAIFAPAAPEVLQAARLFAIGADLNEPEREEVIAGCRSSVGQVRLLSLAALESILIAYQDDAACRWTLVSALRDPADEVLERAAAMLSRHPDVVTGQVRDAVVAALLSAYVGGRQSVRLATTEAALAMANDDRTGDARRLLEIAAGDSSWEVRRWAAKATQ